MTGKGYAIVTGGAVRLGRAFSRELSRRGYPVIVHYNRSSAAAEELVELIEREGGRASAVRMDLSDLDQVEQFLGRVNKDYGQPEILVNNAAIFEAATTKETSRDILERTVKINFSAPFLLTRDFARSSPGGHIINILDERVRREDTAYAAYSLSKMALFEMTRLAARELAPDIRVNAIAPGPILPPPGIDDREYMERRGEVTLLRRPGKIEDVIAALGFLLDCSYVTGETIFVSGGGNR